MIGVIGPERWLFNKNDCTSVDRGYGTHISMAVEPANIYDTVVCDAWPLRRQSNGYLPSLSCYSFFLRTKGWPG